MHESRLIRDLMAEAERRAPDGGSSITALTFRIGALAPVSAAALHHAVAERAVALWNTTPEIAIEQSEEPTDPGAMLVALVSLRVES